MSAAEISYRARWVFPATSPPIAHGIVTLDATTRQVLALEDRAAKASDIELGNVAIIPGLVNAHTHLEFSDLHQPLGSPGMNFASWIRCVIEHRRAVANIAAPKSQRTEATRQGLDESCRAGVVAIGEIATPDFPLEAFAAASGPITIFLELLGLSPEREAALLEMARAHLAVLSPNPHPKSKILPGLSPHAPYTASPDLVRQSCALSQDFATPVAMHLAESWDEIELLQSHSGSLVELLSDLEAWRPERIPRGIEPRQYLEWLAEAHRALIIHGNFLQPEDWQFLADRRERMSLVHCPQTHAYFGRGKFPLREILDTGVHVSIGTDSRASNPDLSLFGELQRLYEQHSDVSGVEILGLGTVNGAAALGIEASCCLETAVMVEQPDDTLTDPYDFLFVGSQPHILDD